MNDQADVHRRRSDLQRDLDVARVREVRCRACMRAFRTRQEPWSGDPLEEVRFCPYCGAEITEGPG